MRAAVKGNEIDGGDLRPGWLGTGDQKIGARRCDEVEDQFRDRLSLIGTLALPHHGAKSSYHKQLLELFPGAKPACVVSAGINSQYNHPSREVLMDVAAQGGTIVLVNDGLPSRLTESGCIFYWPWEGFRRIGRCCRLARAHG